MKLEAPRSLLRAALFLSAVGMLLAPLSSQARERANPGREGDQGSEAETGAGGRAGIVEEFNFGPVGMDILLDREDRRDEGGNRLLSGRVIELKNQTLYVERQGVVVPLDVSALRFSKAPREGQQIIASYAVNETKNVALSLAGEVEQPAESGAAP